VQCGFHRGIGIVRKEDRKRLTFVDGVVVREVDARLRRLHGVSRLENKEDPLDELIFVILSGLTREPIYMATYEALRARFPTWDEAAVAAPADIEASIWFGGLAGKKSRAITRLLTAIVARVGRADLSFLCELDDRTAETFLRQLPGVGTKTARCVLAYSLGRPAFAVDVHVSRLMRRLGWSDHGRLTMSAQDRLQEIVPPDIRLSLHVSFVVHGRTVCTALRPRCKDCILADLCPSAFEIGKHTGVASTTSRAPTYARAVPGAGDDVEGMAKVSSRLSIVAMSAETAFSRAKYSS